MAFWGVKGDEQHVQACVDKVVEVDEKVVQQRVVIKLRGIEINLITLNYWSFGICAYRFITKRE